jgi:asparagine synthase (glutamine-hydrolysing)
MRASTELREPFLDHRLVELALRQTPERKIRDGKSKWLLRRITERLLPKGIVEAPKRPLQTPQREWLRGPLKEWTEGCIEDALVAFGGSWLNTPMVRATWRGYMAEAGDSSFHVWQWVSLGLLARERIRRAAPAATCAAAGREGAP